MDDSQRRELNDALYYRSSGSFELLLGPAAFGLLGLWVDSLLGTRVLFAITFGVLAVIGVFCKQYYSYRHAMAQADAARLQAREAQKTTRTRARLRDEVDA